MNPYALPAIDSLRPELAAEGRKLARQLAASGAARGAIVRKLRDIGIDGRCGEELATGALVSRSRRKRMIGMLTLVAGLCLISLAWTLSLFFHARIPVAVAMIGLFVTMLGCANLFHRSEIKSYRGHHG